jgi:cell division septal protein FtsQ
MFFTRKPKNRRFERDRVLNVKVRSKQVMWQRLRLLASALAVMAGTLGALYGFWRGGEWALDQVIFKNEIFAIQVLQIETDGVIPIAQIQRWAGVRSGENLLALDMGRIRRDLELAPLIQSAAVERVLPHTLKIYVTERVPVARIAVFSPRPPEGHFVQIHFHLDREGYVMDPFESRHPGKAGQLPLITGIPRTEPRPGRRVELDQIHAGLRLLEEFGRSPMAGLVDLKSIDVSLSQTVVLTNMDESEITFAPSRLDQQLRRWRMVHDFGKKSGKSIATLDLSVAQNVPARWQQAEMEAAPIIIPMQPSRIPRRKNV